mmetsp:Transcript_101482/g.185178  ORF Transcript_101482/g.185178 Transcript_101482/m.185178 type:complete len:235 (-) Transcript_101482:316-1020(-)
MHEPSEIAFVIRSCARAVASTSQSSASKQPVAGFPWLWHHSNATAPSGGGVRPSSIGITSSCGSPVAVSTAPTARRVLSASAAHCCDWGCRFDWGLVRLDLSAYDAPDCWEEIPSSESVSGRLKLFFIDESWPTVQGGHVARSSSPLTAMRVRNSASLTVRCTLAQSAGAALVSTLSCHLVPASAICVRSSASLTVCWTLSQSSGTELCETPSSPRGIVLVSAPRSLFSTDMLT